MLGWVRDRVQTQCTYTCEFCEELGGKCQVEIQVNGWIVFSFSTALERDQILNGGPYMILGRQLFLKMMPRCFIFKAEDMNFPLGNGLPSDC